MSQTDLRMHWFVCHRGLRCTYAQSAVHLNVTFVLLVHMVAVLTTSELASIGARLRMATPQHTPEVGLAPAVVAAFSL